MPGNLVSVALAGRRRSTVLALAVGVAGAWLGLVVTLARGGGVGAAFVLSGLVAAGALAARRPAGGAPPEGPTIDLVERVHARLAEHGDCINMR
jgi:hypothetical protein